jgi:hypothetical protein
MLRPDTPPSEFFTIWRAWRMWKTEREDTRSSFTASSLWYSLLTLQFIGLAALTAKLMTAKKVLSEEKASWSAADRSFAEEKTAHQTTEQSLQTSYEPRVILARDLESVQTFLTATTSKLAGKSFSLDTTVIRAHEMEIKRKKAKKSWRRLRKSGRWLRTRWWANGSC